MSEVRVKDQILEEKFFLVLLSLRNYTGFRSSVSRTRGREYIIYIYYLHVPKHIIFKS